jgi:ABC-type nitrate/sulfonate/bicarbonate transport system permease component
MDEKTSAGFVPKKLLTKGQMIAVIAVGGLMLLLSIIIPTETPSIAHTIKVIAGIVGVCIIFVGIYFRPPKAPKNRKK